MKVIGEGAGEVYLCEVSHTELEKLTDKYYGKLARLKIGDTLNLGAGYDFRQDIKQSCKGMIDADNTFERSRKSMLAFAVMVRDLPLEEDVLPKESQP